MGTKSKRYKTITSPVKQKVLLLLAGGFSLGLTRSFRRQQYIFRQMKKEWREINRRYLYRIIKEFREDRLVDYRELIDCTIDLVITEAGKFQALRFDIDTMDIKQPTHWDGRWRVVLFDIPEKKRQARDALRDKLRDLGFFEFQKSVFIYPYPCEKEINFVIEFFEIRNYVHYAELSKLTNDAPLKLHFHLP